MAVTVNATPEHIWPWLVQIGYVSAPRHDTHADASDRCEALLRMRYASFAAETHTLVDGRR
jgi:hypothetical protein